MAENHNPVLQNLRHLNQKMDGVNKQMHEFMQGQAEGDEPDPGAFQQLLSQQSVTKTAMTAQFSLFQKPLKTVLSDSK